MTWLARWLSRVFVLLGLIIIVIYVAGPYAPVETDAVFDESPQDGGAADP